MVQQYSKLDQVEEGIQLAEPTDEKEENAVQNVEQDNSVLKEERREENTEATRTSLEISGGGDHDMAALPPEILGERPPPNGVLPGGVWGSSVHYGGSSMVATFACCLLGGWAGCVFCCLPHDRRRVYKAPDSRFYDAYGKLLAASSVTDFKPDTYYRYGEIQVGRVVVETIDADRRFNGCLIAALIVIVLFVLYVGFLIHDRGRFEATILPAHFDGAKFASFARRLRRWKFERVSRGSELGAYYHPDFVRGRPERAAAMAYPGGEEREARGAAKVRGGATGGAQGLEAALEREVERKVRARLSQRERGDEAPDRASASAGRKRPRPDRDPRACDVEVAGLAADAVAGGADPRPLPLPSALPKRPKRPPPILAPAAGGALPPPGLSEESFDVPRLAEFERKPTNVGAAAAVSSIVAPPSVAARHASAGTPSVPTFGILRNDRPLLPAPRSPTSQRMLELERTRRRLEAERDRELLQRTPKMPRRNSVVIPNEAAAKFGGRALLLFGGLGASAGAATDRRDVPLRNDAFAIRTAPGEGGAASARTAHAGSGNAPALRSRDEERGSRSTSSRRSGDRKKEAEGSAVR